MAATTLDTYSSKKGAKGTPKFFTATIHLKVNAGENRYDIPPQTAQQVGLSLEDAINDYLYNSEIVLEVSESTEAVWKKVNA